MTGWRNEPLSAVCDFINRGVSPKYLDNGGIAVLNQKCVRDHEVNHALGRRHDINAKKVSPERLLRAGDVLVNSTGTGTLGRVAQLRDNPAEPTTVDSHVTIVRPVPGLFHPEFFGYALIAIEEQIQAGGEGCGGQTELARAKLADEYHIGFPVDLHEQRRIVGILDQAFEGISTAKANAEKSLHNARELLAVATRQAFDALGERCEARLLGSVCRFENGDRGKNYPGKEHRVAQGIPFINAGHLTPTGIDFAEMDYISPERFALLGNGKVQPMDVLFCLRGSLGKYASVGDLSCGAIASSLVILRPTVELDHEYLLCFLGSTLCTEQIEAFKGGAAQPNLGAKDLKQFAIPLPPIDEQRLTAARILELQDRTSDLLKVTTQKLAALDELTRSLLHQAFSGQL